MAYVLASNLEPNVPEGLLPLLQSDWVESCCAVSICTLVFYDQVITFPRETELIWGRKYGIVTLLFHLNRWATFTWAIVNLADVFVPLSAVPSCIGLDALVYVNSLVLLILWAVFSAARAYAISGGNWWLASAVCSLSMVPAGTNAYGWFSPGWYDIVTLPMVGTICQSGRYISEAANLKFTICTRVAVIASDAIVLSITWSKTYAMKRHAYRHGINSPLATMLLRDGTLYFSLLLCLNIVNIAGWTTKSFVYATGLFNTPLSAVIMTRFLLNLRQSAGDPHDDTAYSTTSSQSSSLRLASFIGNMGELLDHGSESDHIHMSWLDGTDVEKVQGEISGTSGTSSGETSTTAVANDSGLLPPSVEETISRRHNV
ncbi:hypothetical protein OBBRIDRAFT_795312 [Obba rivulosa]|uniref:DUF6533 domain-containing protein n=1 Tax=Obba rivulosa TaxID=1052685 RepID=A0A8E2DIK9_9APHY|nr:hypothetical protein OBBRIDRAFT_795312 [Obba rivulosa]